MVLQPKLLCLIYQIVFCINCISAQTCDSSCKDCVSNTCAQCEDGYWLTSANTCSKCPDNCLTCLSDIQCSTCRDGYYGGTCIRNCLSDKCKDNQCDKNSGYCVDGCVPKYYQSGANCLPCTANCDECSFTPTNCARCSPDWYGMICQYNCSLCLDGKCTRDGCTDGCVEGYYLTTSNYCDKCPSTCPLCTTFQNCDTCSDGYYGETCQYQCSCLTCAKDTGVCTSNCPDGSYYDYTNRSCEACPGNCASCSNPFACVSCIEGWHGDLCQKRYQCSSLNCQECTVADGIETCITCNDGFDLHEGDCVTCDHCMVGGDNCLQTGSCVVCKEKFWGKICMKECEPNCKLCYKSSGVCVECEKGYTGETCRPLSTEAPLTNSTSGPDVTGPSGKMSTGKQSTGRYSTQATQTTTKKAGWHYNDAIVGGAIGGLIGLLLLIVLLVCLVSRCKKDSNDSTVAADDALPTEEKKNGTLFNGEAPTTSSVSEVNEVSGPNPNEIETGVREYPGHAYENVIIAETDPDNVYSMPQKVPKTGSNLTDEAKEIEAFGHAREQLPESPPILPQKLDAILEDVDLTDQSDIIADRTRF